MENYQGKLLIRRERKKKGYVQWTGHYEEIKNLGNLKVEKTLYKSN